MSYIDNNLMPGERVLHRTKTHPLIYLIWVGWFIVISMLATAMLVSLGELRSVPACIGILAVFFGIGTVGNYITYCSSEYGITDRRVIAKTGVLNVRSFEILLTKVEGIGVEQTLFGKVFGYGNIMVTGTGGAKEPFKYIQAPFEFRKRVQAQIAATQGHVP